MKNIYQIGITGLCWWLFVCLSTAYAGAPAPDQGYPTSRVITSPAPAADDPELDRLARSANAWGIGSVLFMVAAYAGLLVVAIAALNNAAILAGIMAIVGLLALAGWGLSMALGWVKIARLHTLLKQRDDPSTSIYYLKKTRAARILLALSSGIFVVAIISYLLKVV